ncbi:MAG: type II secretion system F family protein [Acidimicrobiia bacterium]
MMLLAATLAALAVGTATGLVMGTVPAERRRPPSRPVRSNPLPVRRDGAAAAIAGIVTGVLTRAVLPALAVSAVALAMSVRRRHDKQRREAAALREAWPDALRHMTAVVRSGSSVEAGIVEVAQSAPQPLRAVLRRVESRSRVVGLRAALEALRDESADATTDRVVEVLVLAQERGGSFVPVILEDLADAIAADLRTAEEIRTASMEQRLNARIVFVVPWAMLGLLTLRPGPYRSFYASRPGFVVIAMGGMLSIGGAALAARLARRPPEPRVLARGRS